MRTWIDNHRDEYMVSRLCRVLGVSRTGYCQWRVRPPSPRTLPVAPNVLDRRFDGWQPDRAWVADITYVATGEGWLYLAAVMDLASRRIVG